MVTFSAELAALYTKADAERAELAKVKGENTILRAEIVELRAEVNRLKALLDAKPVPAPEPPPPAPPPEPPPAPPVDPAPVSDIDLANAFTVHDALGAKGTVKVAVTLDRPADRTMSVNYTTRNGSGTYNTAWHPATSGSGQYIGRKGVLIFQPGERRKDIEIALNQALTEAQTINVDLSDFEGWPNHKFARKSAVITGKAVAAPTIAITPARLVVGRPATRFFDDALITNFAATDEGKRADGSLCWRSRLLHGRTQPNNNEAGYYTDPALVPASNPFPIGADGRRQIRAESFPDGVKDKAGKPVLVDYGSAKGQPFRYTAAILHSHKMLTVGVGEYVEASIALTPVMGTWPAMWLLRDDWMWPPEIDIFEGFFKTARSSYPKDLLAFCQHWNDASNRHRMWSIPLSLSEATGQADFNIRDYHVYGCLIGERDLTMFVDNKPVGQVPNLTPKGSRYSLLLNVAVGGIVGTPKADATFPAAMSVEWVRAYR